MGIDTFVDDLLLYLQNAGYGTIGTNLFEGPMNPAVENCITITPYEGTNPTTIKTGEENPFNPFLNVLVRKKNRRQAFDTTVSIFKMWRLVSNAQIGNTKFEHIKARGTWHPLGIDDSGCINYSINFSLKFN